MSLTTPFSVQKLQTALHAKAKESPNLRFHALYGKVYRKDVLAYAYERCQANGGAAGVDNQTFEKASLQSLQCGRSTRPPEAASVVMRQTQRAAPGIQTISGSVSSLRVWLGPVTTPDREPSVGESVSLSERRMREICQSGSMSGNRKPNQAKPD